MMFRPFRRYSYRVMFHHGRHRSFSAAGVVWNSLLPSLGQCNILKRENSSNQTSVPNYSIRLKTVFIYWDVGLYLGDNTITGPGLAVTVTVQVQGYQRSVIVSYFHCKKVLFGAEKLSLYPDCHSKRTVTYCIETCPLPDNGPEQGGPGLVVEGDDDAGGGQPLRRR